MELYGNVVMKDSCLIIMDYSQNRRSCFLAGFAIPDPVHHGEKYRIALLH